MNVINFIAENWAVLVALAAIIAVIILFIKNFSQLPASEQSRRVQEWLLYAVTKAEKELGGGTGQIKLRYVYDMFVDRFPVLAKKIPFDIFNNMVEEALTRMQELLASNVAVKEFVEPEQESKKDFVRKTSRRKPAAKEDNVNADVGNL